MWLEWLVEERNIVKKKGGKHFKKRKKEKKKKKVIEGLTTSRSLFRLRKTLCSLMDPRSAMSLGSSSACSTASVT